MKLRNADVSRSSRYALIGVSAFLLTMVVACSDSTAPVQTITATWATTAEVTDGPTGTRYNFVCPADGFDGTAWGTDIYTDDSSVCTAAVHAGKITMANGGTITIEIRPGLTSYQGSTRNGVTSLEYDDDWPRSFRVL